MTPVGVQSGAQPGRVRVLADQPHAIRSRILEPDADCRTRGCRGYEPAGGSTRDVGVRSPLALSRGSAPRSPSE